MSDFLTATSTPSIKKGDKITFRGREFVVVGSSNDATTSMQRLKAQIRCVRLLQWAGIPPMSPELVALAERLRQRDSDTRPTDGDAKQGSARE